MSNGPAPALLPVPRAKRRGEDRRSVDRRARDKTWRRFDPLFTATLVNQILPPEAPDLSAYEAAERGPRCGIVVNVQA